MNFRKDKKNSIIQVAGLVIGLVTCIFVGQNAVFEYSYDSFHKDKHLIYRTKVTEGRPLGPVAKEQLGYIENYARMHPCYRGVTIISDTKSFHENRAYFADGSLFDILSFPVVKGNAVDALDYKNHMVISERYAKKYFGNEDPIGKTLLINGAYESDVTYIVSGVFKDIPQNSHVQFNILFSIENILAHRMYTEDETWRWSNFFTYFKTKTPVATNQFTSDLTQLALNNGMQENPGGNTSCTVSRLADIHLNGQDNYMDNNRNARDINIRIIIALVVIIIAWLNFIIIGVGSILKNRINVNIRKILGATSINLWSGLFQKTIIQNVVALIISSLLFILIKNVMQKTGITGLSTLASSWQYFFWGLVVFVVVFGALLVSLSIHSLFNRRKMKPAIANNPEPAIGKGSPWISLFVLQFGASIILISFAFFSAKQVNGLMQVETGIKTSQVLALHSANYSLEGDIGTDRKTFENEAIKIPGVTAATSASYIPGNTISSYMDTRLAWKNRNYNIACRMNFVGTDYIPLFEHKIIAGRNFSKEFPTDTEGIIINETLARAYGFTNPDNAVGKEIYWEFRNTNRHIIGVMEDFHHQSADMAVEPTLFQWWDHARGYCLLKINSAKPAATIKRLEKLWKEIHQGNAFDYLWIDQHYQRQFDKWLQFSHTVKLLSFIAILIACIGLFGLSSMLLDKRTKEIGVRKVNGAKIAEVLVLLNRDFVKWVAIAFIIATPIAYYAMKKWLENFAYKTEISWWIFALAGILALGIALLTVSWQSWRVATRNPVEALRYE